MERENTKGWFTMKILTSFLIMILILPLVYSAECKDSKYIMLDLAYENGDIKLIDKSLNIGCATGEINNKKYKIKVNLNDKDIYLSSFDPGVLYADGPKNDEITGGVTELDYKEFSLSVPAYDNSQIKIINPEGKEILSIDVSVIFKEKQNIGEGGLFVEIGNLLESTIGRLFRI